MKKTFLVGKFWNPDHVMDALGQLRDMGVKVHDVFSPFPIHGIEPMLDIKRTRLTVTAFIYGLVGALTAITMISLIYGVIWPMDIGGKPVLPFPDYVPITFEMTVLFAAHGTFLTFLIVSEYYPGKKVLLMDERQTDDVIVLAIDKSKVAEEAIPEINRVLSANEAFEVTEKEV